MSRAFCAARLPRVQTLYRRPPERAAERGRRALLVRGGHVSFRGVGYADPPSFPSPCRNRRLIVLRSAAGSTGLVMYPLHPALMALVGYFSLSSAETMRIIVSALEMAFL